MRPAALVLLLVLVAGCSAPAPVGDPATGPDAIEQVAEARTHDVRFAGHFDTRACVPDGPNTCTLVPLTPDEHRDGTTIAQAGAGTWSLDLVLEWSATTPDELTLVAGTYEACGEGCTATQDTRIASGASPLHLKADGLAASPSGEGLQLRIRVPSASPTPAFGYAHASMDLQVTGVATFTPA